MPEHCEVVAATRRQAARHTLLVASPCNHRHLQIGISYGVPSSKAPLNTGE